MEAEKGTLPTPKIAEKFGIPKSTLSTIIETKDKIDEVVVICLTNCANRLRIPMLEDIQQYFSSGSKKSRDSNNPLSGVLVCEEAREIWILNGVGRMVCSDDGW